MDEGREYAGHETLREALNELVRQDARRARLFSEDSGVRLTFPADGRISIHRGIDRLAECAGERLQVFQRDSRDFPYELRFLYRGIVFSELCTMDTLEGYGYYREDAADGTIK